MKRIFLTVTLAWFTSGCVTQQPPDMPPVMTSCSGASGHPAINITYGDSRIDVNPKSLGKAGKQLQFRLIVIPGGDDPVDYRDMLVTVLGKDAASSWIAGSSTYNTASAGNTFSGGCLPDAATDGTIYRYFVRVEQVGELDPRVQVKN